MDVGAVSWCGRNESPNLAVLRYCRMVALLMTSRLKLVKLGVVGGEDANRCGAAKHAKLSKPG